MLCSIERPVVSTGVLYLMRDIKHSHILAFRPKADHQISAKNLPLDLDMYSTVYIQIVWRMYFYMIKERYDAIKLIGYQEKYYSEVIETYGSFKSPYTISIHKYIKAKNQSKNHKNAKGIRWRIFYIFLSSYISFPMKRPNFGSLSLFLSKAFNITTYRNIVTIIVIFHAFSSTTFSSPKRISTSSQKRRLPFHFNKTASPVEFHLHPLD